MIKWWRYCIGKVLCIYFSVAQIHGIQPRTKEMKWKSEKSTLKDSTMGTHEWKPLSVLWAHLSHFFLSPSETLTSDGGLIYVTVTSLILCFATVLGDKNARWNSLESMSWMNWKKNCCQLSAHVCTHDYTHTQTTHPCSPHTSPASLCGKLLLIATQSASLVHIAFQECLKHTVPHTVKPTSRMCSFQFDIWTESHCSKSDAFLLLLHLMMLLLVDT